MNDDLTELTRDFKEAVSEINFKNYDPYSKTFMKPLFIGQLLLAMKSVESEDDVEEELSGAEKYMNKYLSSGDTSYKDMALDELKHAGILIKKQMVNSNENRKAKLSSYEKERQNLYKIISSKESE